jgi:hypothetical protein
VKLSSLAEFTIILDDYRRWREQFLDGDGRLKPKFRPPPMTSSFMREPAVARRASIPVPKGPGGRLVASMMMVAERVARGRRKDTRQ